LENKFPAQEAITGVHDLLGVCNTTSTKQPLDPLKKRKVYVVLCFNPLKVALPLAADALLYPPPV
jgi:hypothetical protein